MEVEGRRAPPVMRVSVSLKLEEFARKSIGYVSVVRLQGARSARPGTGIGKCFEGRQQAEVGRSSDAPGAAVLGGRVSLLRGLALIEAV
jgi:hypothetical protein